ncbi:hypothetical protein GLW08_21190 [Pontibacillus yanchengensis]|uniref:Uncharacterized protein n=2 Tax=Pontibacillus yanchengensis TaxID=462910 RepID=A0ACC7VLW7_9BACI|nr:hypothetical protein [Pontibacillus yanchengensis]MYL35510.1 hypothetical protein [Pontibacillus yanchengensis]MYL55818.1 hypothetical protein [Pontibacillus yanchengensis]
MSTTLQETMIQVRRKQEVLFSGTTEQVREFIMFELMEEKLGYTPQIEVFHDETDGLEVMIHSSTWEDEDLGYTDKQFEVMARLFPEGRQDHTDIQSFLGIDYVIR